MQDRKYSSRSLRISTALASGICVIAAIPTGAAAQTIPASFFQNNNLLNLIVDNANTTTGVTLGGALDIYRSVTFGASGRKLTTNDNLTFKSSLINTCK